MTTYRVTRWLQRHRAANRLLNRGPMRPVLSRLVWREIAADKEFTASMERGRRDFEEHRTYRASPNLAMHMANPEWPTDGEQPLSPRGVWVPWP